MSDSRDLSWKERAECIGKDNALFFPNIGGYTAKARAICDRCPVTAQCLEYALRERIWHGVWGGLSEKDRRKIDRGQVAFPYRGVGRRQLTYTDCLWPDSGICGHRWGYTKGCRGEHCLGRERAASAEKRAKKKQRTAEHHS